MALIVAAIEEISRSIFVIRSQLALTMEQALLSLLPLFRLLLGVWMPGQKRLRFLADKTPVPFHDERKDAGGVRTIMDNGRAGPLRPAVSGCDGLLLEALVTCWTTMLNTPPPCRTTGSSIESSPA